MLVTAKAHVFRFLLTPHTLFPRVDCTSNGLVHLRSLFSIAATFPLPAGGVLWVTFTDSETCCNLVIFLLARVLLRSGADIFGDAVKSSC